MSSTLNQFEPSPSVGKLHVFVLRWRMWLDELRQEHGNAAAFIESAIGAREIGWPGFGRAFLAVFGLMLLGIALLNFLVNPMGIYPTRLFPTATWNTRDMKAELLAHANPKPQVLILGSSTAMKLSPAEVERLTGLPAFNAAVAGGLTEDYYFMLRYAVERAHAEPKLVIIGVDVWAFDNHLPMDETLLESQSLRYLFPRNELLLEWKRVYKLFTLQQLRLSARSLRLRTLVKTHLEPDGYQRYDINEADRARGHYDLEGKIEEKAADYVDRYSGYTGISTERQHYLEDTLRYCHERGIKVILFVTPMHPRVVAAVESKGYGDRKKEVLAMLDHFSKEWEVPVYDFSAIENFGGNPTWFYDGVHTDERNSDLMMVQLLKPGSSAIQ
jgi:hypothetical protein